MELHEIIKCEKCIYLQGQELSPDCCGGINEAWKDIEGFNGRYKISNLGRVKSIKRIIGNGSGYLKPEQILKYTFDKDGYPMVNITYEKRKNKTKRIHILVATHFIGKKPNNESFVCHKDDNILNPVLDNLYWGTLKSNVEDRYKNGNTKFTIEQIKTIREMFKNGVSQKELRKIFVCNSSYMSRLVNGKRNAFIEKLEINYGEETE